MQAKVYLENHRGRSVPYKKWAQDTSYRGKRRALGDQEEERGKENGSGSGGRPRCAPQKQPQKT